MTWLPQAVALLLCLCVHGCVDVHGGAVELSWKLRAASGSTRTFLDCQLTLEPTNVRVVVSEVQLEWDVAGVVARRRWPCSDYHGVTGFELPEGQALLRVKPICATSDGPAVDGTYTAPAPELRQVIAGNTISLGGVELLLEVSSCDHFGCVCQ